MGARSPQNPLSRLRPTQLLWKLSDGIRQSRERKLLTPTQALGRRGEDVAHRYLQRAGLRIVARNYRPSEGDAEVDIVAREGETLVFVEVKARTSAEFGDPDRAISEQKQKNITRAARTYATRAGVEWQNVRFDTISIVFTNPPAIVHHKDAFLLK